MNRRESSIVQSEIDSGTISIIWNCIERYKKRTEYDDSDIIKVNVTHTSKLTVISVEDKVRVGFNSVRKPSINLAVISVDDIDYLCSMSELD